MLKKCCPLFVPELKFYPSSIDDIKSILTQPTLDALCEKYRIPDTVHPELPGRKSRIRNSPNGKIGVCTRFFDFANYRIPLSQFLVDVLEYFQINLSQLSVIAAAKISHFEILCRVHSFVSIVGNFRRFYINSKNKGWMSFSKRSDTGPVCYTRPLDSLKHWNDHFFLVDAFVFPLVVLWHYNKTLRKDPYPTPIEFNADVCNYLADNPSPFKRFLKPFLCFVSISRYYDLDENCYPTFWADDDKGGWIFFAFIHHTDRTKVRIGERENEVVSDVGNQNDDAHDAENNLIEGNLAGNQEIPVDAGVIRIDYVILATVVEKPKVQKKRRRAKGASGSNHPPKKLREDHDTFGDVGANTGGKSLTKIQELFEQSTLNVEVGITVAAIVPFVTSSVTPTPEREDGWHADSITGPICKHSLQRRGLSYTPHPPVLTAAVATTVIADATSSTAPKASIKPVLRNVDSKTLHQTYIPKWNVTNDSALDEPNICHGIIDHLAPPTLFSQLRSMDYEQLFIEFNVGAARQTCLSSEVRLRLEHELRGRKKFEGKCAMQADWLKERDAEITCLKAQLSLKEAEAAEAIHLRGQIATVEATKAARSNELDGLKEQNAALEGRVTLSCEELSIKASSLESEKDKLIDQVSILEDTCSGLCDEVMGYKFFKEQIEVVQDEQVKMLSDKVILIRGLRLVVMKCLQSPEYLVAVGGAIGRAIYKGMQDGLAAGIDHGKAERGLAEVAAYYPATEANYVAAVNALRDVVAHRLSLSDVMVPLIEPLSAENLTGEASTSRVLEMTTTTALSTTFIQSSSIPSISVVD
ncbi:hypothetical protein Tco_0155190 [Tanacetum coccineum]